MMTLVLEEWVFVVAVPVSDSDRWCRLCIDGEQCSQALQLGPERCQQRQRRTRCERGHAQTSDDELILAARTTHVDSVPNTASASRRHRDTCASLPPPAARHRHVSLSIHHVMLFGLTPRSVIDRMCWCLCWSFVDATNDPTVEKAA